MKKNEKKVKKIVFSILKELSKVTDNDHEAVALLVLSIDFLAAESGDHGLCLLNHASEVIQKVERDCKIKHGGDGVWH